MTHPFLRPFLKDPPHEKNFLHGFCRPDVSRRLCVRRKLLRRCPKRKRRQLGHHAGKRMENAPQCQHAPLPARRHDRAALRSGLAGADPLPAQWKTRCPHHLHKLRKRSQTGTPRQSGHDEAGTLGTVRSGDLGDSGRQSPHARKLPGISGRELAPLFRGKSQDSMERLER